MQYYDIHNISEAHCPSLESNCPECDFTYYVYYVQTLLMDTALLRLGHFDTHVFSIARPCKACFNYAPHWFAMYPIGVMWMQLEKAIDVRVLLELALLYW